MSKPSRASSSLSRPAGLRAAALALAMTIGLPGLQAQNCRKVFVGGDASGASASGGLSPSLSADGRRVAYLQNTFLYHAFVNDLSTGVRRQIDTLSDGTPLTGAAGVVALSADGRRAAFVSSADNAGGLGNQVYVKDLESGALQIVTVDPSGVPMTPTGTLPRFDATSISADGGRVVFASDSKQLVPGKTSGWTDVFVRDLGAGKTTRLLGNGGVEPDSPTLWGTAISADGRWVAFASRAKNLVAGDNNGKIDIFVSDLASGVTQLITKGWNGGGSNQDSEDPVLSADGRYVAFNSRASNLVPGDTNGVQDMFVVDRVTGLVERANVGPLGVQANGPSLHAPRLSADGRRLLFHSVADNLLGAPVSGGHLYLRDLAAQVTTIVVRPTSNSGENDVGSLSADGRSVAFASVEPFGPADTNAFFDVFLTVCLPEQPTSYCPVTASAQGCAQAISWSGTPSATLGSGFTLQTQQSPAQQVGLLIYSTSAAALQPLGAGFLCVASPRATSSALFSGGSPTLDCSGALALDFNAWIAAGSDPQLDSGATLWAQFWCRDPWGPGGHLSNALTFQIGP